MPVHPKATESELELAERAATRAAHSLDGMNERIRSGILAPEIIKLQRDVTGLVREAQGAVASWETAMAVSEIMRSDRGYGEGLDFLNTNTLFIVHRSLVNSAAIAAFRLTDHRRNEKDQLLSLCTVVADMKRLDGDFRFGSEEWAVALGHKPFVVVEAARENAERIEQLIKSVPERWPSSEHENTELARLRLASKSLRDGYLAHYIPADLDELPTYSDVGKLVMLVLSLAEELSLLLKGSEVGSDGFRDWARSNAERFWRGTLDGPKQMWIEHRKRQVGNIKIDQG